MLSIEPRSNMFFESPPTKTSHTNLKLYFIDPAPRNTKWWFLYVICKFVCLLVMTWLHPTSCLILLEMYIGFLLWIIIPVCPNSLKTMIIPYCGCAEWYHSGRHVIICVMICLDMSYHCDIIMHIAQPRIGVIFSIGICRNYKWSGNILGYIPENGFFWHSWANKSK